MGTPAENAIVVLVPSGGRKRAYLYRSAATDAIGRFGFKEVAPGDYKLFAWDDVETGAWQDPDFLRLYESKGRPLRISGSNSEDVQLLLITKP
jgi:hypothetical protein